MVQCKYYYVFCANTMISYLWKTVFVDELASKPILCSVLSNSLTQHNLCIIGYSIASGH